MGCSGFDYMLEPLGIPGLSSVATCVSQAACGAADPSDWGDDCTPAACERGCALADEAHQENFFNGEFVEFAMVPGQSKYNVCVRSR